MCIFDPFGFLGPFVLLAKQYLRETWTLRLSWDDALPDTLYAKWRLFFCRLFEIEKLRYGRCVKPSGDVGSLMLIILSDGSEIAYGCAAYIRWTMDDGSFWCRLLLAKCRIAPTNRISIPQMELNGAVLSKRCRKVIETECRFKFEKVIHLVDSETVLCMINNLNTRSRVYEGVRVGEIQAAIRGDVSCWGWISGDQNISDWVTRGRPPSELGPESEWFMGPKFLYRQYDQWSAKFSPPVVEVLPGEKNMKLGVHVVQSSPYTRCSSLKTVKWAYARILSIINARSFKGSKQAAITPELLSKVERFLIMEVQKTWSVDTVSSNFRTLLPVMQDGIWVVGVRIAHHSPLTPDNKPMVLLPNNHPLTRLIMLEAHRDCGHKGQDTTVARFRSRFWTAHATKMSKSICENCQMCKLLHVRDMDQLMGQMPSVRLVPSPPFTSVMLDLFGPYPVRGEVQKRTTGKARGVIFTDLCSRAVHIEVVFGYDTQSFLLALSRFASIRGWPTVMYSDPGSQLVGANTELVNAWKDINLDTLKKHGSEFGLRWVFGPADSPWYQGAVESLVKSSKKAI